MALCRRGTVYTVGLSLVGTNLVLEELCSFLLKMAPHDPIILPPHHHHTRDWGFRMGFLGLKTPKLMGLMQVTKYGSGVHLFVQPNVQNPQTIALPPSVTTSLFP